MGGNKLGFIDKTGKLVIDLGEEYDEAFPFQEGRARVRKDRSYGFIDTEGKLVIPCEYASCYENFGCLRRRVRSGDISPGTERVRLISNTFIAASRFFPIFSYFSFGANGATKHTKLIIHYYIYEEDFCDCDGRNDDGLQR